MTRFATHLTRAASVAALVILLCSFASAQTKRAKKKPVVTGPTVTRIDIEGLKKLLKPNGKPLLINFWATWCDPCREEFPDLVKLDAAYKGKIDFITISLDDASDIKTSVPKFLREMKAEMPAYLLSTPDENEAITLVSKDWTGNLPLTVLYDADGSLNYTRNGKIFYTAVAANIDHLLNRSAK
jgi:thiol-disulfide isomerase/thioredoxin